MYVYVVTLKEGAKDINDKDLSEFIGIEFDCNIYQDIVHIKNHITKVPIFVKSKYVSIKKPTP